jgi:hypothetical protein
MQGKNLLEQKSSQELEINAFFKNPKLSLKF